jgi:hypothetical protein
VGDAKLSDLLEQRVGLGLEGRRVVEEGLLRGGLKVAELRGDLVGDFSTLGRLYQTCSFWSPVAAMS